MKKEMLFLTLKILSAVILILVFMQTGCSQCQTEDESIIVCNCELDHGRDESYTVEINEPHGNTCYSLIGFGEGLQFDSLAEILKYLADNDIKSVSVAYRGYWMPEDRIELFDQFREKGINVTHFCGYHNLCDRENIPAKPPKK